MSGMLIGRRVLVTGASRGLGAVIALQLARVGADVALIARDAEQLGVVRGQIEQALVGEHQRVFTHVADLAQQEQVETGFDSCNQALGGIDMLINNAAIQGPIGPFDQVDWAAWSQVFAIDLFAAARLCQRVIPQMRARKYGKIINLSGGGATGPRPDFSAYAAAKAALVRFSETLAEELRVDGIDVNSVSPGAMNTRMLDELLAAGPQGAAREYERAMAQQQSGGVPPDQAAALILFLASPAADGITGRLLSAVWDDWTALPDRRDALAGSDIYTLRRIVPADRGQSW
jgi:3-oxoacyl-[acyl-carrier protein] reductase